MAGYLVSDLSHFLDGKGCIAPKTGPAKALADYLAQIVTAFTNDFGSPMAVVPCRRRPGRKPCPGHIRATADEEWQIHWECTACEDAGVISGWENTFWDMTDKP